MQKDPYICCMLVLKISQRSQKHHLRIVSDKVIHPFQWSYNSPPRAGSCCLLSASVPSFLLASRHGLLRVVVRSRFYQIGMNWDGRDEGSVRRARTLGETGKQGLRWQLAKQRCSFHRSGGTASFRILKEYSLLRNHFVPFHSSTKH
jgi:hypothetical protein